METRGPWIKMDGISNVKSNDAILNTTRSNEPSGHGEASAHAHVREGDEEGHVTSSRRRPWARKSKSYSHAHFKVYKRRWFGLGQLVLLNIVVSWDVSTWILQLSSQQTSTHLSLRLRYKIANPPLVANLRPRLHLRSNVLLRLRNRHKLAIHRLPLRLRHHMPLDHLPTTPRPKTQHPRRIRPTASRQLDPLCGHAG